MCVCSIAHCCTQIGHLGRGWVALWGLSPQPYMALPMPKSEGLEIITREASLSMHCSNFGHRRRFWHATLRLRSAINWSSKLELTLVARNANTNHLISEMTYSVSSGTLNPIIPYHTIHRPPTSPRCGQGNAFVNGQKTSIG